MKPDNLHSNSRRRLLTGTAAGVAALLEGGCALRAEPAQRATGEAAPAAAEPGSVPAQAFLEMSAVLTGLHGIANDPMQRMLNLSTAQAYWRGLFSQFPEGLPQLIEAYRRVNPESRKQPLGDAVLARLRDSDEFKTHEFVAKQIVHLWYISQFSADEKSTPVDGGRFEQGQVWKLIGAHPPGFIDRPYGHWTPKP